MNMPDRPTRNAMQTCSAAVKYAYHRKTYEHLTMDDVIAAERVQAWLDQTVEVVAPMPDWSQAPTWAQWWAVDPNGYADWYQEEPVLSLTVSYCGWVAKTINGVQQGNALWAQELDLDLGIDWRTLKQQRPQQEPV